MMIRVFRKELKTILSGDLRIARKSFLGHPVVKCNVDYWWPLLGEGQKI